MPLDGLQRSDQRVVSTCFHAEIASAYWKNRESERMVRGSARYRTATVQVAVPGRQRFLVGAEQGQVDQRRALVAAKRIRLVRPVQLRGAVRIAVELVLGPLVITHRHFDLIEVVHGAGLLANCCHLARIPPSSFRR